MPEREGKPGRWIPIRTVDVPCRVSEPMEPVWVPERTPAEEPERGPVPEDPREPIPELEPV